MKIYWKDISRVLNLVFGIEIPFNFVTLYLGGVKVLDQKRDKKLFQALLVASKKNITRKWLNPVSPTLDGWFDIVLEIFKMEKLTYTLNIQKDKFYDIWNKCIKYATPIRTDFL